MTTALTLAVTMVMSVAMAMSVAVVFFALLFVPRDLNFLLLCLSVAFHLFYTKAVAISFAYSFVYL